MREGWEIRKLGEVCDFQGGSQPPKSKFIYEPRVGYVRFLQIRDFGSDKNITYIPESKKNRYCNNDDILLGRYGASVGKVLVNKTGAYNVAVMKTIPDENLLMKRYLYYYLSSIDFQSRLLITASRSAQDGFSKDDIFDFPILIPPLPEQQRIVAIIDEAFTVIDKVKANAEKNLKNAKELFESYSQGVFMNKGEGWEEKTLGEIADFRNGINYTKSSRGERIKIVGVKDFHNSFWVPFERLETVIIDGKLNELDLLLKGDILVVRSNGNPQLIGRSLLADDVFGNVSHSGFTIRIRANSLLINSVYLCNFLKISTIRKSLVEGGNGVGIKSLNQVGLSKLVISYPSSLNAQKEIAENINKFSVETQKIETVYQQKLTYLEELKKSILQNAIKGELNTDKEVAV